MHHNHDELYSRKDENSGCATELVLIAISICLVYIHFTVGWSGFIAWERWLLTCGGSTCGS